MKSEEKRAMNVLVWQLMEINFSSCLAGKMSLLMFWQLPSVQRRKVEQRIIISTSERELIHIALIGKNSKPLPFPRSLGFKLTLKCTVWDNFFGTLWSIFSMPARSPLRTSGG